ncbi:MAG: hypothetical protein HWN66_18320 [Candidatus Helarchaeota archaeon]|nr:hypothetical protein [Candidatus Helarchaeota archaeon]
MKKVFGAGLLAVDHIFLSLNDNERPRKYEYLGSSGGGTVSNILCMLSILGHETAIFGITGNDMGERIIKEDFRFFNINHDNIVKRGKRREIKTTRQFTHKILLNGKHSFESTCYECGEKFTRDYQMTENDLTEPIIKVTKNHNLIFDRANKATMKLAEYVKKNNNKVIYDFGFNIYGKYQKNSEIVLNNCDIVKTNEKVFNKFIKGKVDNKIDQWIEQYPHNEHLLITRGDKGVYGFATINNEKIPFNLKAIPCEHFRDSSGAGDIFLALTVSQLLEKRHIKKIEDFIKLIDISQALASLNCTFYGARALQRFFLNNNYTSKEIIKTAIHILNEGKVTNSISPFIGLPESITKPYRLSKLDACETCGSLTKKKRKKVISNNRGKPKITLHKSLEKAPWTMISSYEIGKNHQKILKKILPKGALFVGSGGSLSASIFGETLFIKSLNSLANSISPFELESFDKINNNIPIWFISHGGNNTDILGSAVWAKEKLNIKNGIVITGSKNSKLSQLASEYNWITIPIPSRERNFVSVIGYLSQISVLCGLLSPEHELNKLNNFFTEANLIPIFHYYSKKMLSYSYDITTNAKISENLHLIGLARGWGWPAIVDFESKIVEGGISTIEISEFKNYTHGRYINTFGAYDRKSRYVLMLSMPKDEEVVEYLGKKFGKFIKYKVIRTDKIGICGSLELIIQSLFLAWYLGRIANKNILKPRFPREARGLYSWEPAWRKGRWGTL